MIRTWQAVIPSLAATAAVLLAAALYVSGYHDQYMALMTFWGAAPFRFPFLDMYAVTSAIECHRLGYDVFAQNPCDVFQRVHPYSPIWLWFSVLGVTTGWYNPLGLATDLLFLMTLPFLPRGRGWWQTTVITAGTISSAVMFALERANVDVIMFLLAMLVVILTRHSTPFRMLGYGVALIAGLLKFYPIVLLIIAVRERAAWFFGIGLIAFGVIMLWFLLDSHEILQAMANIPTMQYFDEFTFGARDLPYGLAQTLGWSPHAAAGLLFALLAGMVGAAAWLAKLDDTGMRVRRLTDAEATFLLAGCSLTIGCFFAAQNVLYRSIYFLFMLPGLTALARVDGRRRLDGGYFVTICSIIILMWNDAVRSLINAVLSWFGVTARPGDVAHFDVWLVREIMWWGIVTVLTALLLRVILETRTARDTAALLSAMLGSARAARR
jgi:hypothetical protein